MNGTPGAGIEHSLRPRARTSRSGPRGVEPHGGSGARSQREYLAHFSATCSASTTRTVPERERMTIDCVEIRSPR